MIGEIKPEEDVFLSVGKQIDSRNGTGTYLCTTLSWCDEHHCRHLHAFGLYGGIIVFADWHYTPASVQDFNFT